MRRGGDQRCAHARRRGWSTTSTTRSCGGWWRCCWRDMGYAAGGLVAGTVADALGFSGAIAVVAGLTAASGLWVAFDLRGVEACAHETRPVMHGEQLLAGVHGAKSSSRSQLDA